MGTRIGIIGGTGLYKLEGLELKESLKVDTPFGAPSDELKVGQYGANEVVFLPRHGSKHAIMPSEINYRANIWALKHVGVRRVLSVSATGSLREEIAPGDIGVASQYFDWTKRRVLSFFGEGVVGHISTAEPACSTLSNQLKQSAEVAGVNLHMDKTYACVEGPRLGTRAESFFLRTAGCDLVGMTNIPEVFLAREAQLCYCTMAIATDYDCWREDPEEHVTLELVMKRYAATLGKVQSVLKEYLSKEWDESGCMCRTATQQAVVTSDEVMPPEKRELVAFLKS